MHKGVSNKKMKKLIIGTIILATTFFAVKAVKKLYRVATDFSDLNFDDIDWDCT